MTKFLFLRTLTFTIDLFIYWTVKLCRKKKSPHMHFKKTKDEINTLFWTKSRKTGPCWLYVPFKPLQGGKGVPPPPGPYSITVQPLVETTSCNRPLLLNDQFSKIPKVSKSNRYIWNLLYRNNSRKRLRPLKV